MAAERWFLNPALTLRWTAGTLAAHVDEDGPATAVAPAFVGLLDTFREPIEVDEGVRLFLNRYVDDDADAEVVEQVRGFLEQLQDGHVLVNKEAEGRALDEFFPGYFARPDIHVMMLRDYVRTSAFREAIGRHVPGKTVLEVGAGSGVLACFAARAGARKVYAIEETPIIDVAREIVSRNGLDDRIEFIQGNSSLVEIPEPADVVYAEIIGSDPLAERILPSTRDAVNRFLKPGGTLIPQRLSIFAVCLQSTSVNNTRVSNDQRRRQAHELGSMYGGLDLSPLVDAYEGYLDGIDDGYLAYQRLEVPVEEQGDRPPVILSEERMIGTWDLHESTLSACTSSGDVEVTANTALDEILRVRLRFPVERTGIHNAIAVYFSVELDDDLSLSNSPFVVQSPISWGGQAIRSLPDVEVAEGDEVEVEVLVDPSRHPTLAFTRPD